MRFCDVVEHIDTGQRGQVVWFRGRGIYGHNRVFSDDEYVIQTHPGSYVAGNAISNWKVVPPEEWTAVERVRSAFLTYERPFWLEEGEEPQGLDTLEWQLIRAIVGENEFDDRYEDYWPDDLRLWVEFAEWVESKESKE